MKKKGQSEVLQLTLLFEVLVGLAVAAFLIYSALNYSNITGFNKKFLEEDLKLLIDSVVSAPADVTVKYPVSTQYSIEVKENITIKQEPSLLNDPFNKESFLVIGKKSGEFFIRRESVK